MIAAGSDLKETCFLSYARADEEFALRFAGDLHSLGALIWMDQLDLRPSQRWDRAIEQAIRACSNVIVILSPRSVASENVADEISLAIDCGKPVIPVMIEPCDLPLRITRMHLIDATRNYQAALTECFAQIEGDGRDSSPFAAATKIRGISDLEIIRSATQNLARIVGPIADILVKRAASETASVETFYGLLSLHIHDEDERSSFIDSAPQLRLPNGGLDGSTGANSAAKTDKIGVVDLERFGRILSNYLGPIGVLIARRESRASHSLEDLRRRLADTLRDQNDRAEFFRQAALRNGSLEVP